MAAKWGPSSPRAWKTWSSRPPSDSRQGDSRPSDSPPGEHVTVEPQVWLAFALIGKSVIVFSWLIAVILIENRWSAAVVPLRLAGYGLAWFARWGRNFGFFALNAGLAPLLVLPVTFYAAAHPLWTRPDFLSFTYAL